MHIKSKYNLIDMRKIFKISILLIILTNCKNFKKNMDFLCEVKSNKLIGDSTLNNFFYMVEANGEKMYKYIVDSGYTLVGKWELKEKKIYYYPFIEEKCKYCQKYLIIDLEKYKKGRKYMIRNKKDYNECFTSIYDVYYFRRYFILVKNIIKSNNDIIYHLIMYQYVVHGHIEDDESTDSLKLLNSYSNDMKDIKKRNLRYQLIEFTFSYKKGLSLLNIERSKNDYMYDLPLIPIKLVN